MNTQISPEIPPNQKRPLSWKLKLLVALIVILGTAGTLIHQLTSVDTAPSTDDAYIKADATIVAPKVAGFIAKVYVTDNQQVHKGQILATIDDSDYRTAQASARAQVSTAEAALKHADASLVQQNAVIAEAKAKVVAGKAEVNFAHKDQARYESLSKKGLGSLQQTQKAQSSAEAAQAELDYARAGLIAAEHQVTVLQTLKDSALGQLAVAKAHLEKAELNLSYTQIISPIDGVVGARSLRLGAFVKPGSPLLAVVPVKHAYIVANFRETELAHVSVDQPVSITIDSIPGLHFIGHVQSISPSTGLALSPIKPMNSTGNFTKVVQRIPVRIEFDWDGHPSEKIRAGMSVVATIHTHKESNPDRVSIAMATR